ncbi:hypothetical protein L207DRAFT_589198 [Hyaloscypha variabilis F]|uniref:Uncharacterized protein n=1 Tax=Hyaloscypha variabilis (strain UAMH 11265 / GT02V1 / F) TaxID=1149755 RepID=A0A2J6R540_HYAVF|nr:hypothetical protein L207DRAFT_589198 [Hyaloscypha variabilis F]
MHPRQRLQQDHAKADPLNGIQDTKPKPQRAADERRARGRAGPWYVLSDVRAGPEDLRPARSTEADCEERQDPGVGVREAGKAVQDCGPDEDEEEDDEEGDLPDGGVGGGPDEGPVAAGHGAEEVFWMMTTKKNHITILRRRSEM